MIPNSVTTIVSSIDDFASIDSPAFRILFDKLPFGFYRCLPSGEMIWMNKVLSDLLGCKKNEELSKTKLQDLFLLSSDYQKLTANIQAPACSYEHSIKTHAGTVVVCVKHTFSGIFDSDENLVGISGFIENLDLEKETREQQASTELFGELVDNAYLGVGLLDKANKVIFCNPSFADIFQVSAADIIGKKISEVSVEIDELVLEPDHWDDQVSFFEFTFHNNNSLKHVQVTAKPRLNANKEVIGTFLNLFDVTERVNIERELTKARDKACESDRLKSSFMTNLSHEIRTPMNGILGFANMLKNDALPYPKKVQYLDIIISRSKHLMELLNNIIDVTKIDEGHLQLTPCIFNINELLRNIYRAHNAELASTSKDIKLKLNVLNNVPEIHSDSFYLQQVVSHLLNNAIKFTDEGSIDFGYTIADKKTLQFYVRDTGIGINPENNDLIFDRFRQVDDSFTRLYGGLGLGLTICKGFVEKLGGKIWVESDGQSGSTFYFTIPYSSVANSLSTDQNYTSDLQDEALKNKTIFIVEDDEASYEYMKEVLTAKGCNVIHAANGTDAIQMISEISYIDLVLLDIQLPERDGYDVARQIKKTHPKLPVIAQTAHAFSDDRKKCFDCGCVDYLSKPIRFEVLIDKVKEHI